MRSAICRVATPPGIRSDDAIRLAGCRRSSRSAPELTRQDRLAVDDQRALSWPSNRRARRRKDGRGMRPRSYATRQRRVSVTLPCVTPGLDACSSRACTRRSATCCRRASPSTSWLHAEGAARGTIFAPFYAPSAVSQAGRRRVRTITSRAGEYAAVWTVESMAPCCARRSQRIARLASQAAAPAHCQKSGRKSYLRSRPSARVKQGLARIDVRESIFCTVREPVKHPLCGFTPPHSTNCSRFSISAIALKSSHAAG